MVVDQRFPGLLVEPENALYVEPSVNAGAAKPTTGIVASPTCFMTDDRRFVMCSPSARPSAGKDFR
jgi:hypothetical protein